MTEQPAKDAIKTALMRLEEVVREFLAIYEYGDGESFCITPSDDESALITDAVHGLLADDDFIEAFEHWRAQVRADKDAGAQGAPP